MIFPRSAAIAHPKIRATKQRLRALGSRYGARGGLSLIDQALTVGAPFAITVELARLLTRSDYGFFTLVYTALIFFRAVHGALVTEPCFVFSSGRFRDAFEDYRALGFWLTAATGLGIAAAIFATYGTLLLAIPGWAGPMLPALAVAAALVFQATFVRQFCYASGAIGAAVAMSSAYAATLGVGLFLLIRESRLNGAGALLLLGIAWLPALALMTHRWRLEPWRVRRFLNNHNDYARQHWSYARWLLATAVVFQFLSYAYYWLAAVFISAAAVADLRASGNILRPADQVFIALDLLILPKMCAYFSQGRYKDFRRVLHRFTYLVGLLAGIFSVGVLFLGRLAMHWLYAGKYDDTIVLLFPMLAASMIVAIGNTYNTALRAAEYPSAVFWAYVGSAIVTIVLGIPLVIIWGTHGAATGMMVSAGAYTCTMYIGYRLRVAGHFRTGHIIVVAVP